MEAATEPLLVVIDRPVAGNPAQFAIESALRAMQLDWRVLSFDVPPEDVAAALEGFRVTGIAGVLIGPALQAAAAHWYRDQDQTSPTRIDCLTRHPEQGLVGTDQQSEWVIGCVMAHLTDQGKLGGDNTEEGKAKTVTPPLGIWFGESLDELPIDRALLAERPVAVPPPAGTLEAADWVVLGRAERGPVLLEEEEWPENDGSTLVIDLSNCRLDDQHPGLETLEDLGYAVVTSLDRRVGTLRRALRLWTGIDPPPDVIHDAIEEYLGV